MTVTAIPQLDRALRSHYMRLKSRYATRDRNNELIHQVRKGNITQLFPEELDFSISFNGSPIANFVDIVARDLAEGLAPLPSLACTSGKMESDADKNRAERKNRIGSNYWIQSNLEFQMLSGADQFVTYGFLPFYAEPDVDNRLPFIQVEDPLHSYYEKDRRGNVTVYAHYWRRSVDDLCAMFKQYAPAIRSGPDGKEVSGDRELELVRWCDDKYVTLLLPEREGLILARYEHKLSCVPVWIAERPGLDPTPRGQFDDVIWVQVARAIMATLALEAASIAVQAPIAVPRDMNELPIGPHALLESENAKDIHKVNLELPPQIFAENQALDQELRVGARYPDARSGVPQASVITGKGVEALLGSFDSQIRGGQMILKRALEKITAVCFEMDEVWWPNESKTVNGTISGASFELSYTPAKDIAGRYSVTATYGFAAGLRDPSQAGVFMLQLEGAGLISKETFRENLPIAIDGMQEKRKIDIEQSREALKQGLFALLQAAGDMAAQGADPTPIINLAATVIKSLENGDAFETAVSDAFAAMKEKQEAEAQAQQDAEGSMGEQGEMGGDMGGGPGGPPQGPEGVAPGQAGLPPGGRPTLEQLISGFRGNGNLPVSQVQIRRQVPTGT